MRLLTSTLSLAWVCILWIIATPSGAQDHVMTNGRINTCSGRFFDSGGPTGRYRTNESFTFTICPNQPGRRIKLDFSELKLGENDVVSFYDGTNTSATLLASWDKYQNIVNEILTIQASQESPTGCITVTFNAEGFLFGRQDGWTANISCAYVCQPVEARIVSSVPAINPVDTGWIDICPGQSITLNGGGIYQDSGQPNKYPQSDASSTFTWDFGDASESVTGQSVTHTFQKSGGYVVSLSVQDDLGCPNRNAVNQRVRVAPPPAMSVIDVPADVCPGDSIQLNALVNVPPSPNVNISVTPDTGAFQVFNIRADSLALPDGEGVFYESSIRFNDFAPGQRIRTANDIKSICVNMEHTWVRDLEIELICPDGKAVMLHDFQGKYGKEVFLGQPVDSDHGPGGMIVGKGSTYCWTNQATETWLEYSNRVFGSTVANTLPAGDYAPAEDFSGLVNCPLNGDWTLRIKDLWLIDNGFIFWWSINFNDNLSSNDPEFFVPSITNAQWSGPDIVSSSASSMVAIPTSGGDKLYQFQVTDQFGCTNDTTVTVSVKPLDDPDCNRCQAKFSNLGPDQNLCFGQGPVNLEVRTLPNATQLYDGIYRYRWTPATGLSCSDCPNPVANPAQKTTYTVEVLSDIGCTFHDTISIEIAQNPLPALQLDSVGIASPSCPGDQDGSAVVYLSGGSGQYSYEWILPQGIRQSNVDDLAAGVYNVMAFDQHPCSADTVQSLVTIQDPSPLSITLLASDVSCYGDTDGAVQLTVNGGTPNYRFSWSNGAGGQNLLGLPAGSYATTVTDAKGCQAQSSTMVLQPDPIVAELVPNHPACFGDETGAIRIEVQGGVGPYVFTANDFDYKSQNPIENLKVGDYKVVIFDAMGCKFSETVSLVAPEQFLVDAGDPQYTIGLGDTMLLKAVTLNAADGPVKFSWSATGEKDISCADCSSTVAFPTYTSDVQLTAVDANGCRATDKVTIVVEKDKLLWTPTGFSPNDDGVNDLLHVFGKKGTWVKEFKMFDRWGELLYQQTEFPVNSPVIGWDGRFNGKELPVGVYVWYIRAELLDGRENVYMGNTTLVR